MNYIRSLLVFFSLTGSSIIVIGQEDPFIFKAGSAERDITPETGKELPGIYGKNYPEFTLDQIAQTIQAFVLADAAHVTKAFSAIMILVFQCIRLFSSIARSTGLVIGGTNLLDLPMAWKLGRIVC